MRNQEKIKSKMDETKFRVIMTLFALSLCVFFNFKLLFMIDDLIDGSVFRTIFCLVIALLVGALTYFEFFFAIDYIEARFRSLWNVIYIAIHQDEELEFSFMGMENKKRTED